MSLAFNTLRGTESLGARVVSPWSESRALGLLAALSIGVAAVPAFPARACSMLPPPPLVTTPDGRREPVHGARDYAIWGEVIGYEDLRLGQSQSPFTAIRVRVLRTDTERARPGEEISFHVFTIIGADCSWDGISLSPAKFPIGSRLRIVARGNRIAKWEADAALQRVEFPDSETR